MRTLLVLLLSFGLWCFSSQADSAVNISANLENLKHSLFEIQGIRLGLDDDKGKLSVQKLTLFGRVWQSLALTCPKAAWDTGVFDCRNGTLQIPEYHAAPLPVSVWQQGDNWIIELSPEPSERWRLHYFSDGRMELRVENGKLALLSIFVPELKPYQIQGRVSGLFSYAPKAGVKARFDLEEGGFSSQDGRQASEAIGATISLTAQEKNKNWILETALDWKKGAFYTDPFLFEAAQQNIHVKASFGDSAWQVDKLSLDWPTVGILRGKLAGTYAKGLESLHLMTDAFSLEKLGNTLFKPLMEARGSAPVSLTGEVSGAIEWTEGQWSRIDLGLKGAGAALASPDFAIKNLSGHFLWQTNQASQNLLTVESLRLGRLESGAFELSLGLEPGKIEITQPVVIPVLDSQLIISHFGFDFSDPEMPGQGKFGLSLYPVSLEEFTRRLGLPVMGGIISANLPSIRYQNDALTLEGALVIQVFEGYLNWTDLRISNLFNGIPVIKADIDARNLNLGQLTQTFSFGQITGFLDAEIKGLEVAGGALQAFDAKLASSPGDYPRRISQKAVADITAIGGGGARAAIQASFLHFFKEFGYRRIGLSCRLKNDICHVQGIEGIPDQNSYTLIEGGGIPALTVIGYNSAIQWNELLQRIRTATQNSSGPVIQ